MRIFGERSLARVLIGHQRDPGIAGQQIGALGPFRNRPKAQHSRVELERSLDIGDRQRDMVDADDHAARSARTISRSRSITRRSPASASR